MQQRQWHSPYIVMAAVCPPCLLIVLLCALLTSHLQNVFSTATLTATAPNPSSNTNRHWSTSTTKTRKLGNTMVSLPLALPPAPNSGCNQICGTEGSNTVPSMMQCGCVTPIKIGLELQVTLDALFPLMIELEVELADGSFLQQSQVRIVGANPVSSNPDNTIVKADLVPLGTGFDNITAKLITERFWTRQVFINQSLFGIYSVQYVLFPGINLYAPTQPSDGGVPGAPVLNPRPGTEGGKTPGGKGQVINHGLVALVALSSGFGLLVVFGAISVLCMGLHARKDEIRTAYDQPPISSTFRGSGEGSRFSSFMNNSPSMSFISSVAACAGFVRTFSLFELEIATGRFDPDNVVGEGGFGRVYRGRLEDGCNVAVKVLTGAGREFVAEVEVLSRLHHRNLVKLIGICTEDYTRCLVYELVSNGSLESHLHGIADDGQEHHTSPLDWNTRIKIALGAARGLAYLHEDANPRVIHRDFKASNILLEDDCTAKVSDFGLAKVATEGGNEHVSTRVMGTFGYVAPEYAMTGHLLVKSDVYSFGVVLLELLTGRQPVEMDRPPGQENLVTWARPLLIDKETLSAFVDPTLEGNYPPEDLAKVAAVAYRCVHPEVSQRPLMGEVVQTLKLVDHESITAAAAAAAAGENANAGSTGHVSDPEQQYFYRQQLQPQRDGGSSGNFFKSSTELSSSVWGGMGGGGQQPAHPNAQSRYAPDGVMLMNMEYDSGQWGNSLEMDSSRPLSASAAVPNTLHNPLSGSFQRQSNSGPLRPARSRLSWYKFRHWRNSGIVSDEHAGAGRRFNPRSRDRHRYQRS